MKLTGDYHTHTIYSKRKCNPFYHSKSTLEDNVRRASELGLKEIAITDHGFNHRLYCTYRKRLPELKKECIRLSQKYNVNVLLGVEANIISAKGDVDIIPEDYKYLDIVLCGYHKIVRYKSIKDEWRLLYSNKIKNMFHSKKNVARNTEAYISAIRKYNIDILTHPGQNIPIDYVAVAKACAEKGTLVEINRKNFKLSDEDILAMAKTGCKFIIDSDAHKHQDVGAVDKFVALMERLGLIDQVVNVDKLPEFINYKRKTQENV